MSTPTMPNTLSPRSVAGQNPSDLPPDASTILHPPATLVLGPSGTGKTTSLITYLLANPPIEVFALVTEPTGVDSLLDACKRYNAPIDLLHWRVVAPVAAGWQALKEMATKVRALSYEDLSKLKQGIGKEHQKQLDLLLDTCADFYDQRTGKRFGDVTLWDDSRAFCFDSLSGFNSIAMAQTVGMKPAAHQGEWGVAMNLEEQVILKLVSDCQCYFTLTAHVDRVVDEVTTTSRIVAAALGSKLAPKIARWFSEIPLSIRAGNRFTWSTADLQTDVKQRALPIASDLAQSFIPIVEAHRARKKAGVPVFDSTTGAPLP